MAEPTPHPSPARAAPRIEPALVAILAGVCAALHVGKLPPAIPALQAALGLSLVQAGFLLSMVQLAGMSAGVAFGALADGLGARRSMLLGLGVLAGVSAAGAFAHSAAALMWLRAAEGFGFLLVVLAAPALVRRLVAPERLSLMLGTWGAYMPLGTALALLGGPGVVAAWGWAAWWLLLAAASAAVAVWLARAVPASAASALPSAPSAAPRPRLPALRAQLAHTLRSRGPWLLALAFAVYSGQWLAVIGFLPTIYSQAGLSVALTGALTATVAAANMVCNRAGGRLLHRGVPAPRLLRIGYTTMAVCALLAFAANPFSGQGEPLLPPSLRFAAVLLFSGVGGLIPSTLFTLAVPATPAGGSLPATAGWMQQWSAAGQFFGPPGVAWVAAAAGGWQFTWVVTGACALAGLALTVAIAGRVAGQVARHVARSAARADDSAQVPPDGSPARPGHDSTSRSR